jgi:hypothetical protein
MAWRKWLVRGLVLFFFGGLAVVAFCYHRWTNPEAVRQQVIDKLASHMVGAQINLESASLRLLGGISFGELRISRRDDPKQPDLAYIPCGIIYPDKEQVAHGKVAIRKIELQRPKILLRRDAAGEWNWQDIMGAENLEEPVPTLVIRQGTLVFEDFASQPAQPAVEITNVHLTFINDPLDTIIIQGTGESELAGAIQIQGTAQRGTNHTILSFRAGPFSVGTALVERLGAIRPDLLEHARDLAGTARLEAEIGYSPGTPQPLAHHLTVELNEGKLNHPKIPLPLEKIRAVVDCMDGRLHLKEFTAWSGTAEVQIEGQAQQIHLDADFAGTMTIKHLSLKSEIFDHLPEHIKKIDRDFAPNGLVSLTYYCSREGKNWRKRCTVEPEDLSASFVHFPYVLEHITGTIHHESDTLLHHEEIQFDLAGLAGSQRVYIKGSMAGEPPFPEVRMKIWGDNLPMDQKLHAALPAHYQKLAASFHPTGLGNFEAHIFRKNGSPDFLNCYLIRFHDATVKYDVFAYPLEEVSGILDIHPDHWEFYDFRGRHKGGEVFTAGRFQPNPANHNEDQLTVRIRGQNVVLDSELEAALNDPEMKQAWKVFSPTGRMHFSATVNRVGPKPPEVEVGVTALGCSIKPEFFPYFVTDLTGTMHYLRRWVHVEKLQARHGKSVVKLEKGKFFCKPEGGVWGEISKLQGRLLLPDADLLRALPPVLRKTCETLEIKDPVTFESNLTVATAPGNVTSPDIYWDGKIGLQDASVKTGVLWEQVSGTVGCQGRYNGRELEGMVGNISVNQARLFAQSFQDIQGTMEIRKEAPDVLVIPGIYARIYGGEVYGPVRVNLGPQPDYELKLTASQVRLEEFGRHNLKRDAPISGLVNAQLHLQGKGPDIRDLTGRGSIDVENGQMYNLPPILDLLKFLSLSPPDGTLFEEAHANFTIRGQRVAVSRMDLFGNFISLRGQGDMNLDGTELNLDFFAVWARVIQLLPPVIKELPQELSKYLLKIKMRGRINDVRFTKEPVPVVLEPIKGILEKMIKMRKDNKLAPRRPA